MTRLWTFEVVAELDENGDVVVDYNIDDTVSVAELVGHIEVVKHRIINEALTDEDEDLTE